MFVNDEIFSTFTGIVVVFWANIRDLCVQNLNEIRIFSLCLFHQTIIWLLFFCSYPIGVFFIFNALCPTLFWPFLREIHLRWLVNEHEWRHMTLGKFQKELM